MNCNVLLQEISDEIADVLVLISNEECNCLVGAILKADNIFVAGMGRSGYIGRCFAMRLMHLGLSVHFVGEPTAPAIQPSDLLIVASGSGATSGLVSMATKATSIGTAIALVSIYPDSPIGQMAGCIVRVPTNTCKNSDTDGDAIISRQPMANLFEQTLFILLDYVVIQLMNRLNTNADAMFERHANLE